MIRIVLFCLALFYAMGLQAENVLWNFLGGSHYGAQDGVDGVLMLEWHSDDYSIWPSVGIGYNRGTDGVIIRAYMNQMEFMGAWFQQNYGDVIDSALLERNICFESSWDWGDHFPAGTELSRYDVFIPVGETVYLSVVAEAALWNGHDDHSGNYYYGWAEFSYEGDKLILASSALDLDGGPMIVGGGAYSVPEPSGGLLFVLGAAALGLRRRIGRGDCPRFGSEPVRSDL